MEQLKKIKWLYSVLSAGMIITGILLLICPGIGVKIIFRITGILFIVLGTVKLFGYFSKDIFQLAFQYDLAIGIVFIIMGIILTIRPAKMAELGTEMLGIIMVVDALLRIQTTIDAKKFGLEKWWQLLLISLTAAVTGVLLLIMPLTGTKIIVSLVGLNICINGVLNFVIVRSTVKINRGEIKWE